MGAPGWFVPWEDTKTIAELASRAGISLHQAMSILADLGDMRAKDMCRIVGSVAEQRERSGR